MKERRMAPRRVQRPPEADEVGHFKVRIVVPGAMLHVASRCEPEVLLCEQGRHVLGLSLDLLENVGDTIGYIRWGEVTAITWRYTPGGEP